MYRCELLPLTPYTQRDTHTYAQSASTPLFPFLGNGLTVYPAAQSRNHFQTLPFPSLTPIPPCPPLSSTFILVQATTCILSGLLWEPPKWSSLLVLPPYTPKVILSLLLKSLNGYSLPLGLSPNSPLTRTHSVLSFATFFLLSKFQSTLNLKSFKFIERVIYALSHSGPSCIFFPLLEYLPILPMTWLMSTKFSRSQLQCNYCEIFTDYTMPPS